MISVSLVKWVVSVNRDRTVVSGMVAGCEEIENRPGSIRSLCLPLYTLEFIQYLGCWEVEGSPPDLNAGDRNRYRESSRGSFS